MKKNDIPLAHILLSIYSKCTKVVYRGSLCGIFLDLSRTFGLGNIQLFRPRLILTVTQSKVDFLCIRVYMFYTRTGYHTWFILDFSLCFLGYTHRRIRCCIDNVLIISYGAASLYMYFTTPFL